MKIKLWKRYVALLLIGAILGGSGMLFIYGREMEQMMLVKRSLELLNEKLMEENQSLKQSEKVARRKQEVVIDEIRVTVLDSKLHETIQLQMTRQLEKDLASLKGKKVEQVAEVQEMLHEMLRRREYIIEGTMVEVRVKTVAISRILHLFVTAEVKREDI
ncbi:hypothetical protein HN020_24850 [Brevibacillus borstelensis]|uniref:hypothetical protein n=1 Tax=Brevibacillus borstelensis TaxID=45462 RepID=UPI00149030AD|nr:hypothetical protein [Brevibacillus borstelensis]MCC0565675.1 hypothetical protein [Brevibacillus borstelensis]MCM3471474.1 hypothetical protein [Brevibacillus borstelensis]MCM3559564.1 hypothetical protein [Brevibacillus borstelensis]MCM3592833.1 hypothetical protein [Brevibacillus borstelensis]MED1851508.1 hypothetical protein [Brevibacillus borstelensis]